jgi:hypothetical protein
VYEVVSEAIEPLWRMMPGGDGPPLLLDRRAVLVPGIDGYPMPDFYHWLLLPFSKRKVGSRHCITIMLQIRQIETRLLKYIQHRDLRSRYASERCGPTEASRTTLPSRH